MEKEQAKRRGHLVAIVGPDGVGKTTLARSLLSAWEGPSGYVHFRPPWFSNLPRTPDKPGAIPPKSKETGPVVVGWMRLLYNLIHFWIGYLLQVKPILRRNGLVVADRWAFGYIAQPRSLRFHGPAWLARSVLTIFPRPTLVVLALAPVSTIFARKQELTPNEISNELIAWEAIAAGNNSMRVDTTYAPEVLAVAIRTHLLAPGS